MPARTHHVLLAVLTLAACEGTTVRLVPLASEDGVTDSAVPDTDDAADPTADDPAADDPVEDETPMPPVDQCIDVCSVLSGCDPRDWIPPCGPLCPGFSPGGRGCIHDLPALMCLDAIDCLIIVDPPPQCGALCDRYNSTCEPIEPNMCRGYCSVLSETTRSCADDALDSGDCAAADACLFADDFGYTCDHICAMASDECGFPVDPVDCRDRCDSFSTGGVVYSCLDTAVYLGDCEALASCGGILP